jgi:hypothetical protein
MAVLELDAATVTEVRIAAISVIAIPRSELGQSDPHAEVSLAFGAEVNGNFAPRYYEVHSFNGAEFAQFVALLGTLEGQTLEAVRQIKGLSGTIK